MKISDNELNTISQALSYAVMFSNDEAETAEFIIIRIKVDHELHKRRADNYKRATTLCKYCKEPLDKNAIIEVGICTSCFTSNA